MNKPPRPNKSALLALAWTSTLLLSLLPDILFQELSGTIPNWLYAAKLALIAALLYLSLFWAPAKILQKYFFVFLAIFLALSCGIWLSDLPVWVSWFPLDVSNFVPYLIGAEFKQLIIAGLVMVGLLLIGLRRQDFFLRPGELDAPAAPMPGLGVGKATSWRPLGLRLSLFAFLAMLLATSFYAVDRLTVEAAWAALPFLPLIIVLAGLSAFSAEIIYRAALLAPIHHTLGPVHSVALAAAFFGISWFYGLPLGLLGVLFWGFFGWMLGRSLLETKGLLWPWFIHASANVVMFAFIVIAAVQLAG